MPLLLQMVSLHIYMVHWKGVVVALVRSVFYYFFIILFSLLFYVFLLVSRSFCRLCGGVVKKREVFSWRHLCEGRVKGQKRQSSQHGKKARTWKTDKTIIKIIQGED